MKNRQISALKILFFILLCVLPALAAGQQLHATNQDLVKLINFNLIVLVFSVAVLLVLMLLHTTLYIKYREDKANAVISVFMLLVIITVMSNRGPVFFGLNNFQHRIATALFALSSNLALLMVPYMLSLMFNMKTFAKAKHLIWLTPFGFLTFFYFNNIYVLYLLLLAVIVLGLVIWILLRARRKNKFGVLYVAGGTIITYAALIVSMLFSINIIQANLLSRVLLAILVYTGIPFGLTLYTASRYSYLYNSMEDEVQKRTGELEQAYNNLQKSHKELKAAQNQLVQQEKLASLGQLTAGIAHEIKNPLNFVNNFSDVSVEMIEEAREEISSQLSAVSNQPSEGKGKSPFEGGAEADAEVGDVLGTISELLNDIEANLRKIHEHGSRADGIVKSMLLHSRGKSGEKMPTNINSLLEEYVNLAYHGMRATDKSFNIDIQTNFDEDIPKMNLVAQDISRALLNIINNGMYAAHEKAQQNGKEPPALSVQTQQIDGNAEIRIRDNGPGIPDEIREKIFEPFFTTKPTGQGTGLGLSMTFDIIKMHNGTLDVESAEGQFTEFIITLPVNNL